MKKPPARKPKTKKTPKPAKASPMKPDVERAPGTWDKIVSLVKSAVGRKPHAAPAKKKRATR